MDNWIWAHRAEIDFAIRAFIYAAGLFAIWVIVRSIRDAGRS